eukprot:scaffold253677_cov14-Tisochrysis_lutea.AAC.1
MNRDTFAYKSSKSPFTRIYKSSPGWFAYRPAGTAPTQLLLQAGTAGKPLPLLSSSIAKNHARF